MAAKTNVLTNGSDRPPLPQTLRRVLFSMGGKGGTGKSTVMAGIAEYLQSIGVTPEKIDLDWENKKEGSLQAWFPDATKVDIREPKAYDILLRRAFLTSTDVVLADLGAAQGYRLYEWFDTIYADAVKMGLPVRFTAIGVVNADPASRSSVLEWASHMQDRVNYLIVLNRHREEDIVAWSGSQVEAFRQAFSPIEIHIDARDSEIEGKLRENRRTLTSVVEAGITDASELNDPATYIRVFGYRERLFHELTKANSVILP